MSNDHTYGAIAPLLLAGGYEPIPITLPTDRADWIKSPGKQPSTRKWQAPNEANRRVWLRDHQDKGVGLLTRILPACDADFTDPSVVGMIEAIARRILGDTPLRRVGKAPKVLLPYRADTPFKKMSTPFLLPPGAADDAGGQRVEMLCDRQQFVAFGVHPGTGKPYYYTGASPLEVPTYQLPTITEAQARAFVEAVEGEIYPDLLAAGWRFKDEPREARKAKARVETPRQNREHVSAADDPFGPLKSAAMSRLADWVPVMIAGAVASGEGYRCVAKWRNCENPNVGIHPTGIMDFGGDEGLSPIDLVMKSRGLTFIEAARELAWRLNVPMPEIKHAAAEGEYCAMPVCAPAPARLPAGLTGARLERYAAAALRKAADKVVGAPEVGRASVLSVATWSMSRKFLQVLGPQKIADAMAAAGMASGIERRDITRAIESGLRAGGVQ
ncbi:MAG: hypothetical protein WCO00_17475 [Rhodospirillaceae bacterium]